MKEQRLVLNKGYVIKPELGYALIMPKETVLDFGDDSYERGFMSRIHPMHGYILSQFDGVTETASIVKKLSVELDLEEDFVDNFVKKIAENECAVGFHFQENLILLPKNCLVFQDYTRGDLPKPGEFNIEIPLDVSRARHNTPTDVTLMLNTICATDCVYCYADRRVKMNCKIPFNRIKELIKEARSLHMRSFEVIGGEFFLYKQWREMLLALKEFGYTPAISTKVPISEDDIRFLKDINVKAVQISLDSLIKENICSMLDVKESYIEQIKTTITLFQKYKVPLFLHTVMSSSNDSIEDMKSILDFIKEFDTIYTWRIDITSASLYKPIDQYLTTRPSIKNLNQIISFFESLDKSAIPFKVVYEGISSVEYESSELRKEAQVTGFPKRSYCSGNKSSFFILPDGNVTICEELYWNKNFIIGNVKEQGLREIWDSKRALDNHYMKQEDFPSDSACATCAVFEECRWGKGVCFRDTMKAYGEDKWYYPDVKCIKSPAIAHEYMV